MKKEELNKLVRIEAIALKTNARPKELEKLDFKSLGPLFYGGCIYGQMTGSCFNTRATNLIKKCATKMVDGEIGDEVTPISRRKVMKDKNRKVGNLIPNTRWSPIEVFIGAKSNCKNGNVKHLIKFLKGETKTLKIK